MTIALAPLLTAATLAVAQAPAQAAMQAVVQAPVQAGLDRIVSEKGGALRGKRVGLLAHAASVTWEGQHAVDALREAGVVVVRLFAPEHGARGLAAAGERIADGRDAATALPVVSLYGARARPERADFDGLDALVVDVQDVGVRFYTYAATLLHSLDAAAEAGVEVVVLDRPNPLGGERVEGPRADHEGVPASLLSTTPGPLVHGLTVGELARMVNASRKTPARLSVVPMDRWRRSMQWADTGRPWTPPSPNLRTADAALVYPGTCLLEATNVTEGRGTGSPFLLFGSPWLRADAVIKEVAASGLELAPIRFTPRSSASAPEPKYRDVEVAGISIRVVQPAEVRPYAFGLELLATLRRAHPEFAWRSPGALDRLLGTRRVREGLERGDSVARLLEAASADVEAHRRARQPYLLY